MIIDVFNHTWTREYLKAIEQSEVPYVLKKFAADRFYLDVYGLGIEADNDSPLLNPESRIKTMDRFGIDMQALTLATPATDKSGSSGLKLCKAYNDSVAKIVEKHPDRFVGVAQVPTYDVGEALDETERAIGELGLKGIQMYSDVDGKCLDSPELYPIYEKIVKYDLPIWVQPGASYPMQTVYGKYRLDYVFTWDFDSIIAISRLIMSGVFDRYPALKIITHHIAHYLPYWLERLELIYDQPWTRDKVGIKAVKPPAGYFKLLYHDTAFPHKPFNNGLIDVYETLGSDKMLFGTDYPFGPNDGETLVKWSLAAVNGAKIPDEDKKKILGSNAMKLLKL